MQSTNALGQSRIESRARSAEGTRRMTRASAAAAKNTTNRNPLQRHPFLSNSQTQTLPALRPAIRCHGSQVPVCSGKMHNKLVCLALFACATQEATSFSFSPSVGTRWAATRAGVISHGSAWRIAAGTMAAKSRRAAPWALEMMAGAGGSLELFSPAKTNLFLRITRKRDDGFHELGSVFQALGVGDVLTFSLLESDATQDVLTCNVPEVPLDEKNLVWKAFDIFRRKTGKKVYFSCDMRKETPLEGGLGGGSSNAATAMWAANSMCGSPASDSDLIEWGGELGSDVSFFFSEGTAYCTGRGEIVENIVPSLSTPKGSFWIMKPEEGCPTGQVYKNLGLSPGQDLPGPNPDELRDAMIKGGISADVCINDLEPPAHMVLPKLKDIKKALGQSGFTTVLLSGSGATTFAHSPDPSADPRVALKGKGVGIEDMFVAGPLSFVTRKEGGWYTK